MGCPPGAFPVLWQIPALWSERPVYAGSWNRKALEQSAFRQITTPTLPVRLVAVRVCYTGSVFRTTSNSAESVPIEHIWKKLCSRSLQWHGAAGGRTLRSDLDAGGEQLGQALCQRDERPACKAIGGIDLQGLLVLEPGFPGHAGGFVGLSKVVVNAR